MDLFRKPTVWNEPADPAAPAGTPRIPAVGLSRLLVVGAGMGLALAIVVGVIAAWRQAVGDDHILVNGVRLRRSEHAWLTRNRAWLGEPVFAGQFEGRRCLFLTYFAACRLGGTSDGWELLDLGRRDALRRRIPLRPDAPTDPVIVAYLSELERHAVPWQERLGRFPITDVFCLSAGRGSSEIECTTHFANAELRWRPGSSEVRLTPLGEQYAPHR
jgi:hypothetical protein